jgi:hypothetical protein
MLGGMADVTEILSAIEAGDPKAAELLSWCTTNCTSALWCLAEFDLLSRPPSARFTAN